MSGVVRITNSTGNPKDTKIIVDGKLLPLSHIMDVTIHISPEGQITAGVRLIVDDLDTLAQVNVQEN